ncbi:dTMP kinase [bacterium]|nr:dTMP kinase [bacterium]
MNPDSRHAGSGVFISLEGGEGSGKSTLMGHLRKFLESEGYEVCETREPGGPPIAERIREILLDPECRAMDARTELFLYLASRRQNVVEEIRPTLKQGGAVLCDRFLDASVAYQGGGRQLGFELVDRLNGVAVEDTFPDLTLLLDLDPGLGLARGPGVSDENREKGDRIEREGSGFHRRVRQAYLDAAQRSPERFVLLDATEPEEKVAEAALAALRNLLARKP